ncbi:MAG: response regulator transcription factor [Acidobacteria bacterium]|nr:response regulator transcription factor [Acidobacteriota bacterium]
MRPNNQQRTRKKIKILIADRESIFRIGVKKLFSLEDDLRVVAQAENARQALAMVKSFRPDLAIVQQELAAGEDGNLMAKIRRQSPECKVVLTASVVSEDLRAQALESSASGLISKADEPEAFVKSVRKVLEGESIFAAAEAPLAGQELIGGNGRRARPVDTLTRRERTIISCLTQGWRNREIAQHLTITEQTVKNHLRSVYDKVGVSDRLELVLYAIHQHLELPPVGP